MLQLETQLETLESTRTTEARSVRNVDRTVKDLQSQLDRRDKSATLLSEDLNKARDKIGNLLSTIDELQVSDSTAQLSMKRTERELREEREKSLRLERELEGWKGLRFERGSGIQRSGTLLALSDDGRVGGRDSMSAERRGSSMDPGGRSSTPNGRLTSKVNGGSDLLNVSAPQRRTSLTKGFL